ncbi:rodlet layer protein [Streptacidiphilus pinicola]|uniref:Rodlet layer protein n=1 Tax=Streptacidiphilus pinicola TaxID=2219663 RepID=A0A2X0KDG7_9ACTN|nr:rodlet layer protein [Streptacidiphilus pinicola]RAG87095.1 rodlet layer protein [Streptacidiphilus pinicola]
MYKKALGAMSLAATALAMAAVPASAISDSDGQATGIQGNGGTNMTATHGNDSPNFHTLDNPNICVPEVHNIAVAVIGVAVPVEVPVLSQQLKQYCNVGETTQGTGDGGVSHLIG